MNKLAGYLTHRWGNKYYITAKPGHRVYETEDRYFITLKKQKGANKYMPDTVNIYFYKDDFKDAINFKIKLFDKIIIKLRNLFESFTTIKHWDEYQTDK